jgi:hypothetical protein
MSPVAQTRTHDRRSFEDDSGCDLLFGKSLINKQRESKLRRGLRKRVYYIFTDISMLYI